MLSLLLAVLVLLVVFALPGALALLLGTDSRTAGHRGTLPSALGWPAPKAPR